MLEKYAAKYIISLYTFDYLRKHEMAAKKFGENPVWHCLILFSLAMAIGLYLLITTVMVSKDSIFYIEKAQKMQNDLADTLSSRPALYEFAILKSHTLFQALTGNSCLQGWLWAAQSVTLLCKTAAIIVLYLLGCLIAKPKYSFMGCVILLVLPEAAHLGSDVLREWPNLLFMSLAFLCLLYGARKNNPWAFFLVGLCGGLSFLIRSESAQVLVFAGIILIALIIASKTNQGRLRAVTGGLLLITGFSCTFLLYAHHSGHMQTRYLEKYHAKAQSAVTHTAPERKEAGENSTDASLPGFFYEFFKSNGELMMWFFLPFWLIGLYSRLRHDADATERFLVIALIATSAGLILFRFMCVQPKLSERWCLPYIALTAVYIPIGIEKATQWLAKRSQERMKSPEPPAWALLAVGIVICLPNLVKPLGHDRKEYVEAARWLKDNTAATACVYSFDRCIPFYADRSYTLYNENRPLKRTLKADYLITLSKTGSPELVLPAGVTPVKSIPIKSGAKELHIFKYAERP